MSTLETTAKTLTEIQKESKTLWIQYFSKRTDERKAVAESFDLKKKWVPLEEAQKIIKAKYEEEIEVLLNKQIEIQDLKDKIVEALKILDGLLTPSPDGCRVFPSPQKLERLREVLK